MSNSFLKLLKENPNARKVFGERELKIIEKQLQGVSLTQSEKNRLSRDIRKKFDFIKEASKFEDEFKLKKSDMINNMISDVKERILESKYFPRIKTIYLFGSTTDKERTLMSDIDIAVEFDNIDTKNATEFRIKMNYNKKIDVQVYNILPDKIKKEINDYGKSIYKRKNK